MKNLATLVSIDPSMRNLGYAIYNIPNWSDYRLREIASVHMPGRAVKNWYQEAYLMAHASARSIEAALDMVHSAEHLVFICELQESWQGPKGQMSVDAGAIQKLYFFTGVFMRQLREIKHYTGLWGVRPTNGKGQMPKDVAMRRARVVIDKHLGQDKGQGIPHDVAEAILIGKYACNHIMKVEDHIDFNTPLYLIHHLHKAITHQFEYRMY
jgi:hypothetical protein